MCNNASECIAETLCLENDLKQGENSTMKFTASNNAGKYLKVLKGELHIQHCVQCLPVINIFKFFCPPILQKMARHFNRLEFFFLDLISTNLELLIPT